MGPIATVPTILPYDDAMRHSVREGDYCLAPVNDGFAAYAPGEILFDDSTPESDF